MLGCCLPTAQWLGALAAPTAIVEASEAGTKLLVPAVTQERSREARLPRWLVLEASCSSPPQASRHPPGVGMVTPISQEGKVGLTPGEHGLTGEKQGWAGTCQLL